MTNTELIDLFRNVERSNHPVCNGCPMKYTCDKNQITRCLFGCAADALEAAEKRIAELEAQLPKRGEWIDGDARKVTARCSACGRLRLGNGAEWANKHVRFCENCGARCGE